MENIAQSKIETTFALLFFMLPMMINPSFAADDCDSAFKQCSSWEGRAGSGKACHDDCKECIKACIHFSGPRAQCARIHHSCR
ncbi:MAG: hypothetical protein BGO67_00055 [Alphaproteobacteria bacterium 41-28]|nr:MAG: hypothetical protein BGO67_00055 [Alphaproteobacteria bacterium 41-28]